MTTYDIKDEVRDMDVDSVDKSLVNLKIENPSSINKLMNPTPELAQPSVLVPVSVAPVSIPPISVPPPVVPPSVGGGVGGASGGDTLPTLTVPSVTTLPSFPPPLPKAMHVSPLSELVNPSPSTNGSANGNGHISNIPDGSIRSILAEPPAQEPQMPALEPVQEAAALENYIPSDVNNADAHSVADLDSASDKKLSHAARSYRHIKKKDGEPLWRNEIQFDFQRILFENEERVFTNPFPDPQVPGIGNPEKYTFAELYIRTLSESSKCSKILKERFLSNKEMAISVLKVCLLVNCGRMNTTINFVPEMRSTLRTYHSIPSLQGDPIYGGSKPLQDTPRLKSILKNITMDGVEPYRILDDLLRHPKENKPNTNVIDMIFLLSNHTHSIKFFDEGVNNNLENTFLDFFLNTKIHPNSRARRFLWLIYTYLETSFQPLEIAQNPFGEGNGSTNIPEMEMITEEEYEKEFDVDTEFERKYSEQMKELRQKYLNDEEHNSTPKRGNKSKKEREEEDAMMQQYVEKLAAEKDDGDYFVPSSEGASVSIVEESVTESNPDSTTTVESTESSNGFKLPDDRKRHADLEEIKKRAKKTVPFGASISSPLSQTVISAADQENGSTNEDKEANGSKESNHSNAAAASSHYGNNGTIPPFTPLGIHRTKMENSDHNPHFPVETMDILLEKIQEISNIAPTNKTSMASHLNISNKSRPLIRQFRGNAKILSADFAAKSDDLREWINKYFQYKKSINNGVLGMEWENLRYDLINGVESFIYKQHGKMYHNIIQNKNPGDRISEQQSHQPEGASSDSNPASGEVDEVGFGFVPIYDFNKINELNVFLRDLIKFCKVSYGIDEVKSLKKNPPRNENYIKFDFNAGKVDINLEF